MKFEFIDNKNWKYIFTIEEEDLSFVNINSVNEKGSLIHKDDVAFCDDVFLWKEYHLRKDTPLVSKEAREFCEKSITSFMKMKVFW